MTEEKKVIPLRRSPSEPADPAPEYVPVRDNYADDGMMFPMMTPELRDAIDQENTKREARGERKLVGRDYTNFVAGLPAAFKYGTRPKTPGELMIWTEDKHGNKLPKPIPWSVDEKRATMKGCADLNQERRKGDLEPITLEEYVTGRRK